MIKKIQFENKVAIQNDEEVPIKNKVTDVDLNEIKETVNNNAEELENTNAKLLNKASKTELQEATIALQAELLKAQEEIERQDKDYKAGTIEGQAEGESLYLQDSSNARFREFGIGGNDKQATRSGINFYNANDKLNFSDVVVVDKDDWITITGDNSSGNSLLFKNFMTKNNKNIKSNTTYYLVVEIKNIAGEGRIILASASASEVEGAIKTSVGIDFSDLSTGKKVCSVTTKENLESLNNPSLLRSYVQFKAGQSGSITFRMSLLEAEPTLSTFEYEPYGAMPSLEFSSEVKAVGQDINIFDSSIFEDIEQNGVKIKRNVDGTLTLNGTYAGTSAWNYRFNLLEPISVDKEELYLSMQKIEGNCTGQIRFTAWEQNNDNRWLSFETSQYSNLLAEKTYIRASIIIYEGATFDNLTIGLKISNKKDAIYSPYDHSSANITVCNKNLCDNVFELGQINSETGEDYNNTATKCIRSKNYLKIKPNTQYAMTNPIKNKGRKNRFYDKNKNYLGYRIKEGTFLAQQGDTDLKRIGTTPDNAYYMKFELEFDDAQIGQDVIDGKYQYQLEEGSTATDYIAHEEQVFTVPVQQEMLAEDTFVKVDGVWKEKHTWGKKTFTGQESILSVNRRNTNTILIQANIAGCYIPNDTEYKNIYAYSNYFAGSGRNTVFDDNVNTVALGNSNSRILFSVPLETVGTDEVEQLSNFKAKLQELYNAGTPVTVYYQLAEPQYLACTEAQIEVLDEIEKTLHSYKGGTHVYSVDEISPIFNARYTKDLNAVINNLSQEAIGGN